MKEVRLMTDLHSAGTLLRTAREASGLHVAALAVAMKVPVKKLEALEADRLDLLPDAVFVRALASSVCRTLKIDATPVLEKLPQSSIPRLDAEERGINAPFHAHGQSSGMSVPDFFARPAVLAVLALLIGVGVLVLFPEYRTLPPSVDSGALMVPVPAAPAGVVPEAVSESAPKSVQPSETSQAVSAPVAVIPAPPARPVSDLVRTELVPPGAEVPSVNFGLLAFRARGTSWVEVTDAKGVVQLRKTLVSGERVATSGALPLSVVVGRADATLVEVRGKEFSLDAIAKDNVARFEVK
jgi:cytoskeleton protein RodZ